MKEPQVIIRERCKALTNKFDHRKFLSVGSACVGQEGLFDNGLDLSAYCPCC